MRDDFRMLTYRKLQLCNMQIYTSSLPSLISTGSLEIGAKLNISSRNQIRMFTNRKRHITAFPSRLVGSVTPTQNLETGTYRCLHVTNVLIVHSNAFYKTFNFQTYRNGGVSLCKGCGVRLRHHGPLVANRCFRAYRKYSRMSDEQQSYSR